MASTIFYRFRSSKEPSSVSFDGTGLSVFELKRQIILQSALGNGQDFDLVLSSNEGDRAYEDDTEIIPRSTTVVAKRLPAAKPGKGKAARYLTGKPPVAAKNFGRGEHPGSKHNITSRGEATSAFDIGTSETQSEAQRMDAVLKIGAEQWKRQQVDMASAMPIHRTGMKARPSNVPNHPPPPYYTCHRCEKKGHWLQECPENGNPAFDDMRRVKKTMGIPRSQLKVIDRPTTGSDGNAGDTRPPPGVMVDADGNWVIAKPDQVAWDRYQEKATKSAAAREEAERGSEELQQKGLECPLDKRLFVEPTKTPCCGNTYCKQCIVDALLDDGLQCPGCKTDGVPIDDLRPDLPMTEKVEAFKKEKQALARATDTSDPASATSTTHTDRTRSGRTPSQAESGRKTLLGQPESVSKSESRKRKAESGANERNAKSPKPDTRQNKAADSETKMDKALPRGSKLPEELAFMNQPGLVGPNPVPLASGFMNMSTSVGSAGMAMWNPMMMMPYGPTNSQWGSVAGEIPTALSMGYGVQSASQASRAAEQGKRSAK